MSDQEVSLENGAVFGAAIDGSSRTETGPRQVGGPYRDARDGLTARRRALERELRRIDRELGKEPTTRRARARRACRVLERTLLVGIGLLVPAVLVLAVVPALYDGRIDPLRLRALELRQLRATQERVSAIEEARVVDVELLTQRIDRLEDANARLQPLADRTARIEALLGSSPAVITTQELDEHIRQTGDTTWEVDQPLVERALALASELQTNARIIPHEEDGRVVGVKLYGIRAGSMLARLGLLNGDMLASVNGYDLSSPDTTLEAYSRLREADALFLTLERRGRTRVHAYRIVR